MPVVQQHVRVIPHNATLSVGVAGAAPFQFAAAANVCGSLRVGGTTSLVGWVVVVCLNLCVYGRVE